MSLYPLPEMTRYKPLRDSHNDNDQDDDDDVPTLLSWSAGDNCRLRAPRRLCSTAVCDLTCSSTGHQSVQPVEAKLPDNTQLRAGPATSVRLPSGPSGFCAANGRYLGHSDTGPGQG